MWGLYNHEEEVMAMEGETVAMGGNCGHRREITNVGVRGGNFDYGRGILVA